MAPETRHTPRRQFALPSRPALARTLLAATLLLAACFFPLGPAAAAERYDANGDGVLDGGDVIALVHHLKSGGPPPKVDCDANGDGALTLADVTWLTNYLARHKTIARKVVGVGGGTIAAEGFTLKIPAGALSRTTTVAIEAGDSPFPDAALRSRYYRVRGLQDVATGSFTVSVPAATGSGYASPEPAAAGMPAQDYFLLPGPVFFWSAGKVRVEPTLVPALTGGQGACPSGSICGTLLPETSALGSALELYAVRRYRVPSGSASPPPERIVPSTKHFLINLTEDQVEAYDLNLAGHLGPLLENLRADLATQFGLAWPLAMEAIPTVIQFRTMNAHAESNLHMVGSYGDYIDISDRYLASGITQELRITLAHELMHVLQAQYDPRWGRTLRLTWDYWAGNGDALAWLSEAVATYVEWYYDPGHATPENFEQFYNFLFAGVKQTEATMARRFPGLDFDVRMDMVRTHGYAVSPLIKFLADHHPKGNKVIGSIYKSIYDHWLPTGWRDPMDVLLDHFAAATLPNPSWDWWDNVLAEQLAGRLFPPVDPRRPLQPSRHTFTLNPLPIEPEQWHWDRYQDLSAKVYLVKLEGDPAIWADDAALTVGAFQVDSASEIWPLSGRLLAYEVFSPEGPNPVYIPIEPTSPADSPYFTVPNLIGLRNRNSWLMLVLSNVWTSSPYTDELDIGLMLALGQGEDYVDESASGAATLTWSVSGLDNVWHVGTIANPSGVSNLYYADLPAVGTQATLNAAVTYDNSVCDPLSGIPPSLEVTAFGQTQIVPGTCPSTPGPVTIGAEVTAPMGWASPELSVFFDNGGGLVPSKVLQAVIGPLVYECPGWRLAGCGTP